MRELPHLRKFEYGWPAMMYAKQYLWKVNYDLRRGCPLKKYKMPRINQQRMRLSEPKLTEDSETPRYLEAEDPSRVSKTLVLRMRSYICCNSLQNGLRHPFSKRTWNRITTQFRMTSPHPSARQAPGTRSLHFSRQRS